MLAAFHKYVLSYLCLSRNRERKNEEKRSRRLRFLNEKRSARKIEKRRIRENARRCLKRVSGCRVCVCVCMGGGQFSRKYADRKRFLGAQVVALSRSMRPTTVRCCNSIVSRGDKWGRICASLATTCRPPLASEWHSPWIVSLVFLLIPDCSRRKSFHQRQKAIVPLRTWWRPPDPRITQIIAIIAFLLKLLPRLINPWTAVKSCVTIKQRRTKRDALMIYGLSTGFYLWYDRR